jgi:hypothetical protein
MTLLLRYPENKLPKHNDDHYIVAFGTSHLVNHVRMSLAGLSGLPTSY